MAILEALSISQLQTVEHILTEMEAEGVTSLAAARVLVHAVRWGQHQRRIKKFTQPKTRLRLCPDCQQPMVVTATVNADKDEMGAEYYQENSELIVYTCPKCRFSMIAENDHA